MLGRTRICSPWLFVMFLKRRGCEFSLPIDKVAPYSFVCWIYRPFYSRRRTGLPWWWWTFGMFWIRGRRKLDPVGLGIRRMNRVPGMSWSWCRLVRLPVRVRGISRGWRCSCLLGRWHRRGVRTGLLLTLTDCFLWPLPLDPFSLLRCQTRSEKRRRESKWFGYKGND